MTTKKSIGFVILLILVILLYNILYIEFIYNKKSDVRKDKLFNDYIENLPDNNIEYLFFGSSHTSSDIKAIDIPNSFNLGSNGKSYLYSYYQLKNLIVNHNLGVEYIILEIDLQTFSSILQQDEFLSSDNIKFYSEIIPYDDLIEFYPGSKTSFWIYKNFPFIGSGDEINIFLEPPETIVGNFGWTEKNGHFLNLINITNGAEERFFEHFNGEEIFSPFSSNYFIKTIELALENNINIIFIKYPLTKEYDEITDLYNLDKKGYYGTIYNNVVPKLIDSGQELIVLDHYSTFFDNPEYFADGDHLNAVGAEKFTQIVNEDLIKLGKNKINQEKIGNPNPVAGSSPTAAIS